MTLNKFIHEQPCQPEVTSKVKCRMMSVSLLPDENNITQQ